MLNLNDLSISDLQSYIDGIREAVEILEVSQYIYDYSELANRKREAQRIIESRKREAQRIIESRFAELEQ